MEKCAYPEMSDISINEYSTELYVTQRNFFIIIFIMTRKKLKTFSG